MNESRAFSQEYWCYLYNFSCLSCRNIDWDCINWEKETSCPDLTDETLAEKRAKASKKLAELHL